MRYLPDGWAIASIEQCAADEVAALTDGPFGSNLKTSHYTDAGPRVIRLQNIGAGTFIDERAHISRDHFESLRRHEAKPGDVVIAMLGDVLPRACVVPEYVGPAIVKADCARLRVHPMLALSRFVAHALNSEQLREQAKALIHGVGRPRLGLRWLRTLGTPIAPIDEQRRIVEALESYFTRLDDAVATLERVQRNLKRYRASVLKSAVEGRLVPTEAKLAREEGRDYESASVLLERILAERRRRWEEAELAKIKAKGKVPKDDKWKAKYKEPVAPDTSDLPELPEGWCWTTAEALSDEVRSITYGVVKLGPVTSGGVPTLRSSNVRHLRMELDYVKPIAKPVSDGYQRTVLHGDEVLVTVRGTLGGVVATPSACVGYNISREVAMIALVEPRLSDLVATFIASDTLQNWIMRHTRGIAYTGINIGTLKQLPIPIPPLAEQPRIVEAVEEQLSVAATIETTAIADVRRCRSLRQSTLKWAFEGRLVDQDPSDEPASVLLDRIQAERAAADASKPKRTTRRKKRSLKK